MRRSQAQERAYVGLGLLYFATLVPVVLSQDTIATLVWLIPIFALAAVAVVGILVWVGQGIYALLTGKVEDT